MQRTKHQWNVQLATETGQIIETVFAAYWSPNKDYVWASIARAAAAEASIERSRKLLPVAATLAV